MRRAVIFAIILGLSGAAGAQQAPYGGIAMGNVSTTPQPGNPGPYFNNSDYSAGQVLQRLRTVCASSDRFDQQRCARGMRLLNNAHRRLQERRRREAEQAAAAQPR